MSSAIPNKIRRIVRNIPSLFLGYNIYADIDKLHLIDHVYMSAFPSAKSFVDLGGVWNVNGAYSLYTLRKHGLPQGTLVDTDFPVELREKLSQNSHLRVLQGDFTSETVIKEIGPVDVAYFFDVLLHQAKPSWSEVLSKYSSFVSCIVIFNQQYVQGQKSIRLTHLPLEEYIAMTKTRRELCEYVYQHADELHPRYQKPWIDFHNISQWGITDHDLRTLMASLGFREIYYRNCGRFLNLPAFENHAFIFIRSVTA